MGIENYTIPQALTVAGIGWGVVFATLGSLILLIWAMVKLSSAVSRRAAAQTEEPQPAAAPPAQPRMVPAKGSCGEVDLYDVDDETAAMVMAVVAHRLQTPLNQLRFRSIRAQDAERGR